jgi:Flp pilus assembly protein TadD
MIMKHKYSKVLLPFVLMAVLFACKPKAQRDAETAEAMITARSLGLAYLEENQLEEAEAEFLRMIKLDPGEVMGYANLGIVYLRMGNYEQAEEWLQKAIRIEPQDPDVRLILAKVYEMSNLMEKALEELEKILEFSPGHVKTLYNLTEIQAASQDPGSLQKRLEYTSRLVESAPENIVPRLNLIEILIRMGEADRALEQMEDLPRIFPEFPKEAVDYYENARNALLKEDTDAASAPFMIFHNYLKVTSPFQAGMMDLKGPGGSLVGSPVITFDQQPLGFQAVDWETALAAIRFTGISSSAGLEFLTVGRERKNADAGRSFITASDYDLDGDVDLYAGHFDPASNTYRHYLLNNEWGVYKDVALRQVLIMMVLVTRPVFSTMTTTVSLTSMWSVKLQPALPEQRDGTLPM